MADRDLSALLDEDQEGAPPGFLLDVDDDRTGTDVEGDEAGCAGEVPKENWDEDGDPLARGEGEA